MSAGRDKESEGAGTRKAEQEEGDAGGEDGECVG